MKREETTLETIRGIEDIGEYEPQGLPADERFVHPEVAVNHGTGGEGRPDKGEANRGCMACEGSSNIALGFSDASD